MVRSPMLFATRLALAAGAVLAPTTGAADDLVCSPDWTAVDAPFFPLAPASEMQPVLSAADVTDANASFLADPFLVRTDLWYMFFEIGVARTRIGLATSVNGLRWEYQRIVLDEPFALSYPHVFQVDGVYYMTPESASEECVRLYQAVSFPDRWERASKLIEGRPFADPTVFRFQDMWWMFVGNGASDTCWLYYSRFLDMGWTEHPMSPIVADNRGRARPGGRTIVLSGDRVFRLAQNSSPNYGHAVRVFQVDVLTTTEYAEHEVLGSPIVEASGGGWNADGMHHVDAWWTGSDWLAATDGIEGNTWCIGIYRTPDTPSAATPLDARAAARLHCAPNPCRGVATLRWSAGSPPARLSVYAPTGRLVLTRPLAAAATHFVWDGTDGRGGAVAAGVYFCALQSVTGATATTRIVVSR